MGLVHAIITLVIIVNVYKTAESKMTIDQIKNTIKPYRNKCLRMTGVDPNLVEATKSGVWSDERALMCYTKCIYSMMKVIKNDDISIKAIFSTVDLMVPDEFAPRMKEILDKCLEIANANSKDLCEKCWMQAKCFQQTDSTSF